MVNMAAGSKATLAEWERRRKHRQNHGAIRNASDAPPLDEIDSITVCGCISCEQLRDLRVHPRRRGRITFTLVTH